MNTPPPSEVAAPMYPGLAPNLPPFPGYPPLEELPVFSMQYPMPSMMPMMPMTPDVIVQMQRGELTQAEPEWEKHLKELPEELQSILFAAFSAVIQKIGPDAAEIMLPAFMWQVWASRHAHYTNLMHMRMQGKARSHETVEEEIARTTDEVTAAMHAGMNQYYEARNAPVACETIA